MKPFPRKGYDTSVHSRFHSRQTFSKSSSDIGMDAVLNARACGSAARDGGVTDHALVLECFRVPQAWLDYPCERPTHIAGVASEVRLMANRLYRPLPFLSSRPPKSQIPSTFAQCEVLIPLLVEDPPCHAPTQPDPH